MTPDRPAAPHYLLGHSESELARLEAQGAIYRNVTLAALRTAGLREGMRVLDLGCGTGDVSLTAAEIVGPTGRVVGVDRSGEGLSFARERAQARLWRNVAFVRGEIDEIADATDHDFVALVGRFVLMHQPEPSVTLRAAAETLRPGGVVAMIESNMATLLGGEHSFPHSALYDELVRWKCDVVSRSADIHAGLRLRSSFVSAGLPVPQARLHAPLEGGPESPYYRYVAESLRSMLPEAARHGIGGFGPDDPDPIEARLRSETVAADGALVVWPVVAAWATTDGRTGR